jgi:hypothetical protein
LSISNYCCFDSISQLKCVDSLLNICIAQKPSTREQISYTDIPVLTVLGGGGPSRLHSRVRKYQSVGDLKRPPDAYATPSCSFRTPPLGSATDEAGRNTYLPS